MCLTRTGLKNTPSAFPHARESGHPVRFPPPWILDGLTGSRSAAYLVFTMPVRDGMLGHIVLNVANLKKSEQFYRSILGMKVSARNRRTKMTFLSFGREHHDVALMELPKGAKIADRKATPKVHHFCIYVSSQEEVDALYPVLKRHRIPIVSGPEFLEVAGNRSISFLDPDSNRVEIACNTNKFEFDNRKQSNKNLQKPLTSEVTDVC